MFRIYSLIPLLISFNIFAADISEECKAELHEVIKILNNDFTDLVYLKDIEIFKQPVFRIWPLANDLNVTEKFSDLSAMKVIRFGGDSPKNTLGQEYALTEDDFYNRLELTRRALITYNDSLVMSEIPVYSQTQMKYCIEIKRLK